MCNLRPRICVNYDHFVWDEMIVISKNDLEQKYVSRFALDAANARAEKAEARAERLKTALMLILDCADYTSGAFGIAKRAVIAG